MSRGQKLHLFQKRFFNIVKNALPGLAPYNQIQKLENTEKFDPICIEVLVFLRSRKGYFIKSIRMCDRYKVSLFAVDVACEAFDYLMVRSSEQMALLILRHLISQKSNLSSDNKMLLEEIGTDLSSLLLTLRWPQLVDRKEYQKIRGTNVQPPKSKNKLEKRKEPGKKKKIESQKPYRSIKLFQKVESGYNLFVYLRKNKVCLSSAENDDWTNESFLGTLNAKGIAKQESTDNRFNNQLLSGKLDVLIIQKSQLFPDYEELIERIFFPVLKKNIRPKLKHSRRTIVQVKSHGKKVGLNMTVQKFLEIRSATIISNEGAVAEIVIENEALKNRALLLLEKFFTPSEDYLKIVEDDPMVSDAILMLIRKTQRVFRGNKTLPYR